MNNIFQMSLEFRTLINQLNEILLGDDSSTVIINGIEKPTITKSISDHFSALSAMVQGRLAFQTKTEMNAAQGGGANLLHNANWKSGFYLGDSGAEYEYQTYKFTENYIPVRPNTIYIHNSSTVFDGAIYDGSKVFISTLRGIDGTSHHYTMPATAAFVRINGPIREPVGGLSFAEKIAFNTLAEVWNDPVNDNNGLYGWIGDRWQSSNADRVLALIDEIKAQPWSKPYQIYADRLIGNTPINAPSTPYNMLDNIAFENGAYIRGNNGIYPAAHMKYSKGFIPVTPNTAYVLSLDAFYSGVFYDNDKNVIGDVGGNDTNSPLSFVTPENCMFVRVNLLVESPSFGEYLVVGKSVPDNNLTGVKWREGFYLGATGEAVLYSLYRYTDTYIPVEPSVYYSFSNAADFIGVVYDAKLTVISWIGIPGGDGRPVSIKMPANAVYVRINMPIKEPDGGVFMYNQTKQGVGYTYPNLYVRRVMPQQLHNAQESDKRHRVNNVDWKQNKALVAGVEVDNSNSEYSLNYLAVEPLTTYCVKDSSLVQGAFYDISNNYLSDISGVGGPINRFTTPSECHFVRLNKAANNQYIEFWQGDLELPQNEQYYLPWLKVKSHQLESVSNYWIGKKIAWYGTSIPAGYPHQNNQDVFSYATRAIRRVGAIPMNYAVPNGVIRRYKTDGSEYGGASFLNTASAINYQKNIINLIGTENEPDLFVFDYGVNDNGADRTDIDKIDLTDPYSTDPSKLSITTRDIKTFVGSYNFVIDKLLTANPRARFVFLTHFSNDERGPNDTDEYKKMNQIIELLAHHWNVPVLKMHRKTGWINRDGHNLVTVFNPDGIHPATDATGKAVDLLTEFAESFLLNEAR